jgi:hypothetical protein
VPTPPAHELSRRPRRTRQALTALDASSLTPDKNLSGRTAKPIENGGGWLAEAGSKGRLTRARRDDTFSSRSSTLALGQLRELSFDSSPAVPLEPRTFLEPGAQVIRGVVVHNDEIGRLLRPMYTSTTLDAIQGVLDRLGTTHIETLPNGLPRAADASDHSRTAELGYDAVWIRDTAFIAEVWRVTGEADKAGRAFKSLIAFCSKPSQAGLLKSGVEAAAAGDVAWARGHCRPHIRFDGMNLTELDEPWGHQQNDALGLFLKETFTLAREGALELDDHDLQMLSLMAAFLKGIDYTTDKELGHWEEAGRENGKVSASTLRCVVAGLQEMRRWAEEAPERQERLQRAFESQVSQHARTFMSFREGGSLDELIARGTKALNDLLPFESKGEGVYRRPADLALTTALYLDQTAQPDDRIIAAETRRDVLAHLKGDLRRSHGDIRYAGDGYWAAYPKLGLGEIEQMNKRNLEDRQEKGIKEQGEAQWTLGAPIESVIHGRQYQRTHDVEDLRRQVFQLNRALGMVTGELSPLGPGTIPESYYQVRATHLDHADLDLWTFHENGLPLNWAKAYLRLAMHAMKESLALDPAGQTGDHGPQGPVREVLASWSAKDNVLRGSVLLENLAYDKEVKLLYSMDGWRTVNEASATFERTAKHGLENWSFQAPIPAPEHRVDFVVKYGVSGEKHLGNNGGRFFSLERGD